MMSGDQIRQVATEAGKKAKRQGLKPWVCKDKNSKPTSIPFLGDYVPNGWAIVDSYFVDSSGFGSPGESALTQEAFFARMKVGRGYAVIEAGEFQVYVGEFITPEEKPKVGAKG